jgi:hypothetical protein
MIGTIRKHSSILWAIIITVVIITFVFWGSQPGGNRSGKQSDGIIGVIGGQPIKVEDYYSAAREASLGYFLSSGEFPDENAKRMGFDLDREAYIRLFMIQKLGEMDIHVSEETVMQKGGEIMQMMGRASGGPGAPPVRLEAFEKNVLIPHRLSAADFENYIRHELGRVQMLNTVAASGRFVTAQDARVLYEREHEELATDAVFFSASNYLAGVTVKPETVQVFFTNRMAIYRLPERVQVKYVAFEISNHLAQAEGELMKTNLSQMVDGYYEKIGTNLYKEAKTVDEKKSMIRTDLIKQEAYNFSKRDANAFVSALNEKASKLEDFEKLAADRKLQVKLTEPFDATEGPTNMTVLASFAKESFARTSDEPIAGPLGGHDAVYVICLYKRLPSEIPPFETVHERVTEDYKFSQATMAAQKAGADFANAVTNGLAAGKKFTPICVEAGVKPVSVPPISLSSRTNDVVNDSLLYQYKQAAFTTAQPGRASGFIPTADGGFVVFVRERLPLNVARLNAELPDFVNRVRAMRQNEAYNTWFRRSAEQDPGFRRIMEGLAKREQRGGPTR